VGGELGVVPAGKLAIRSFWAFTRFLDIPDTDRPEARRYEPAGTTKNPLPRGTIPRGDRVIGGFRC